MFCIGRSYWGYLMFCAQLSFSCRFGNETWIKLVHSKSHQVWVYRTINCEKPFGMYSSVEISAIVSYVQSYNTLFRFYFCFRTAAYVEPFLLWRLGSTWAHCTMVVTFLLGKRLKKQDVMPNKPHYGCYILTRKALKLAIGYIYHKRQPNKHRQPIAVGSDLYPAWLLLFGEQCAGNSNNSSYHECYPDRPRISRPPDKASASATTYSRNGVVYM